MNRSLAFDQFKLSVLKQTAIEVCHTHLQSDGVDLSTPEGIDLARNRVQQQTNTAEIRLLEQRLARAAFRARATAARSKT